MSRGTLQDFPITGGLEHHVGLQCRRSVLVTHVQHKGLLHRFRFPHIQQHMRLRV